ncbi:MarR family winged helix-turn-helix transcriptional regulator [Paenibacillus sp. XY044]|uniref:MarR family winged helix-turn-helix transcriptional regulator n=1 Tax=Paenibacillus sp. XY044 TaxID=2026089 RepID=UPI000B982796|nr:MarR family transcriptional regulator [Paenibacillus sp. XY044]OZB98378.1 MarR family transcriptional regulator [Paenibacillus sp. XY044]
MNGDQGEGTVWAWDKGPLGRLVKTAYIGMRRELEGLLKPYGITHTQWSALGIIDHYPGITPSEMEPILMIERPSVTSLINGLVKRGLVYRRDHPEDARSKQIYLTEPGKELAAQTRHLTQQIDDAVRLEFSPDEYESLRSLLVRVVQRMDRK